MTRRVLYLCTTFPRLSEKFVEREVVALSSRLPLDVRSLWKGGSHPTLPVRKLRLRSLFRLFYVVPLWLLRKPATLTRLIASVLSHPPRSFLGAQETGLGLGAGILLAEEIRKNPPLWIHAVWATAPATTAWVIHLLTGARYSFGAHAYDLFQNGGDPLLREKISSATWIRTTTEAGADEIRGLGADTRKIRLIRRGLDSFPKSSVPREASGPLRILSVGRLVPKKGYADQIELYARLKKAGVSFEASVIGDGPLRKELRNRIQQAGLTGEVRLLGALPHSEVERGMRQADLFLFTGIVSRDGDRDGLPNVIAEAMAHGIPVAARPAPGVCEAVHDGITGICLRDGDPADWAEQIESFWADAPLRREVAADARKWVEEHFRTDKNIRQLVDAIRTSMETHP